MKISKKFIGYFLAFTLGGIYAIISFGLMIFISFGLMDITNTPFVS